MKGTIQLKKESTDRYWLEVMQKGVCPGLVPLSFVEEMDCFAVELNLTGLNGIDGWLLSDRSFMFDGYRRLLRLMRALALALCQAEEFLIPATHLSLEPGDLFLEQENLKLIPYQEKGPAPGASQADESLPGASQADESLPCASHESRRLEEKIEKLLISLENQYPQTHGTYILQQLPEHYDPKELLRILTALEMNLAGT